jgi:hypothetical protein
MAAIVLIVMGVLALAYGGYTHTSETYEATMRPIHMSVEEKERVNIPVWGGVGAIVIGGLLFFLGAPGANAGVRRRTGPASIDAA